MVKRICVTFLFWENAVSYPPNIDRCIRIRSAIYLPPGALRFRIFLAFEHKFLSFRKKKRTNEGAHGVDLPFLTCTDD